MSSMPRELLLFPCNEHADFVVTSFSSRSGPTCSRSLAPGSCVSPKDLCFPVPGLTKVSVSCLTWGAITMGTAWAKEYTHLIAIRVLLGVFEAGLFPCISVYVTPFMCHGVHVPDVQLRVHDVSTRGGRSTNVIHLRVLCGSPRVTLKTDHRLTVKALAGAFGGLIAYGLIQIDSGALVGWQYLYVIEGILSIAAAPLTFFWIPNSIEQAWFLSPKQKQLTIKRIEQNKAFYNPDEPFSWREVAKGALDWKVCVSQT